MTRLLRLTAAAFFAALAVAACSSDDNTASPPLDGGTTGATTTAAETTTPAETTGGGGGQAASTGTITIENFQFGAPLTVAPGAKITVTNKDSAPHDAAADDGSFKTATLAKDESQEITAPTQPGTYKFSCTLHANMTSTGTLVVEG